MGLSICGYSRSGGERGVETVHRAESMSFHASPRGPEPPCRDVFLVVVEYDRPYLTRSFLASLDGAWPLAVVRTGRGPAPSRDYGYPCEILDRPDNPGYAEAVNDGLRLGLSAGFQFFFICNNDILLEPGAVTALRNALVYHAQVGAVSSVITFYPGVDRVWFAGGTLWGDMLVPRHPGYTRKVKEYPFLFPTEFVSGCALMVRRPVLEEVGLMPERYFMYMEDVEWSLRMRKAGWQLAVLGQPLIHHVGSASSGGGRRAPSPLAARYMARNAWKLKRRLGLRWPFYLGQIGVRLPYYVAACLVGGRPAAALSYLRGLMEGVWDYVRGRE